MNASPPLSLGDSGSASRAVPRPVWFAAALLLFLAASWIAFHQEPCPYAYAHQESDPRSAHWWLKPVEINAPRRLPEVHADFNDVFALKDTGHVWAVGSGGLILHSADSGGHWERQYLVDPKGPVADKPLDSSPAAAKRGATAAELRPAPAPSWLRFVPRPLESVALLGMMSMPETKPAPKQPAQNAIDPKSQSFLPTQALSPNEPASSKAAPPPQQQAPIQKEPVKKAVTAKGKQPARTLPTSQHRPVPPPSVAPKSEPELTLRELANSNLYTVHFINPHKGWVAGGNAALFVTEDGGRKWTRLNTGLVKEAIFAVFSRDASQIWMTASIRSDNKIQQVDEWVSVDQGIHWTGLSIGVFNPPPISFLRHYKPRNMISCLRSGNERDPENLNDCLGRQDDQALFENYSINAKSVAQGILRGRSLAFSDPQHGWIAGVSGTLLATDDAGKTWHRTTRKLPQGPKAAEASLPHRVLPAPWHYLSLAAVAFFFVPALKTPKPRVVSESAADLLVSDSPIDSQTADVFDFSSVALGLSRFLRNEKTMPPFTIAVTGEWGSGKSSLMNLLRADLTRYGFRPVWFNAWHHQKEENLLASLLETVRAEAIPPVWRPEGALFRFKLLGIRWGRLWPLIAILLIVFSFSLGYLHAHPAQLDAAVAFTESIPKTLADPAHWFSDESKKVSQGQTASGHISWIAFLLSTGGLLVSLWKGLKGFGVNPASLLVKDATRTRISDLQSLTGFRYRFAAEFRDITRALNPRTLLILIDDLDRCRPEMVLEVLESVNFLAPLRRLLRGPGNGARASGGTRRLELQGRGERAAGAREARRGNGIVRRRDRASSADRVRPAVSRKS